jgi:tRNA threonylcarbamoyladenosine biosynthesis protein TsaB
VLLALDTSTAYVSVAVHDPDEGVLLASYDEVGPMQHGELLAPTITRCLQEAGLVRQDLTAVAVGVGPGPYTGLRVGVVTARTLGLALDIPVYGVCSLDVVAAATEEDGRFTVTADARRKELFWATYDENGRLHAPAVDRPAELAAVGPVVGAGPLLYPDRFPVAGRGPAYPRASDLARVVAAEAAELVDPEPIYLRRPDAVVPAAPKKVS